MGLRAVIREMSVQSVGGGRDLKILKQKLLGAVEPGRYYNDVGDDLATCDRVFVSTRPERVQTEFVGVSEIVFELGIGTLPPRKKEVKVDATISGSGRLRFDLSGGKSVFVRKDWKREKEGDPFNILLISAEMPRARKKRT